MKKFAFYTILFCLRGSVECHVLEGQDRTLLEEETVRLWKVSVAQKDPYVQCDLGYVYYYGQGIIKNELLGVYLWALSAAQGNLVAQEELHLLNYLD